LLFKEYHRILQELSPTAFLFENVTGLLSMQNGKLFPEIVELFASLGYRTSYQVLNAADFGVPQIRERVFIVGTKSKKDFAFPKPTHSAEGAGTSLFAEPKQKWLTLADAISDLPFIPSGDESFAYQSTPQNDFQKQMRENAPQELHDHNAPQNNEKLVRLMEALPDGGSPADIPEHLRPSSGFANTYCRLWWNRPSTTITRNLGTPSSSRCVHPKTARPLTTREGARLQSFPDSYQFYGSRSERNLQIGNAVPPFLSVALKDEVKGMVG
jgi:DNA (cytosine-5)-methyltransferase 1